MIEVAFRTIVPSIKTVVPRIRTQKTVRFWMMWIANIVRDGKLIEPVLETVFGSCGDVESPFRSKGTVHTWFKEFPRDVTDTDGIQKPKWDPCGSEGPKWDPEGFEGPWLDPDVSEEPKWNPGRSEEPKWNHGFRGTKVGSGRVL